MPDKTGAFFAYSSAYQNIESSTADGHGGPPPTLRSIDVVARYATTDVLMSGWLEGERIIAGQGAVISARVGLGRAVLIGFRAQHRGQSHGTFRLLFNAIHLAGH
jgi:hypothetical protein